MKKLLNEMNSCQYLPGSLASLGSDDSFVNDLCKDNKNSSYYRALSSVTQKDQSNNCKDGPRQDMKNILPKVGMYGTYDLEFLSKIAQEQ